MIKIGEKNTVSIRAIKVFISISWLKKIQCQSLLEFLLVAAKYSKFLFISCRKQTVQKKSSNKNLNLFALRTQLTTATLLLNDDKIATAPVMHFQNAMISRMRWKRSWSLLDVSVLSSYWCWMHFSGQWTVITEVYMLKSWPCCNIDF
jgi:hypothetical protein